MTTLRLSTSSSYGILGNLGFSRAGCRELQEAPLLLRLLSLYLGLSLAPSGRFIPFIGNLRQLGSLTGYLLVAATRPGQQQ